MIARIILSLRLFWRRHIVDTLPEYQADIGSDDRAAHSGASLPDEVWERCNPDDNDPHLDPNSCGCGDCLDLVDRIRTRIEREWQAQDDLTILRGIAAASGMAAEL